MFFKSDTFTLAMPGEILANKKGRVSGICRVTGQGADGDETGAGLELKVRESW